MNVHPPSPASTPSPDDERDTLRAQVAALTEALTKQTTLLNALRNREAALESILASAPFGVATAPLGGPLGQANERFCAIVGYSLDELRTMQVSLMTHPDDRPREQALIEELVAGKRSHYVIEKRYIHKDGSLVPVRLVGLLARNTEGVPVQGVAIVEAIGEQLRMNDALRRSEAQYRSLVEDQLDMVLRWRPDGIRVYVNDAYCRFFGRSREELIGVPIDAFTVAADLQAITEAVAQLRPNDAGLIAESRVQRADGRWIWMEWNIRGFFDTGGRLVECQAVGRDISARRDAEATRDVLVAVLEASPDWIGYLDAARKVRYLNRTARQMSGLLSAAEYTALSLADLVPSDTWHMLNAEAFPALQHADTWRGEVALYDVERRLFPAQLTVLALHDSSGAVEQLALIGHDLSDQKRIATERLALERRLLDAQKLESLGVLAGGIAHDFNNILTALMGHTELALTDPRVGGETRRSLEIVMTGVQRAAELTGAILTYAGRGRLSLEPVHVNPIVRELTDLLMISALRHCTVQYELAPDLPAIQADQAQIRQMLLNILVNAAEAIDIAGGTIRIATRLRHLDPSAFSGMPFAEHLAPGHYVEIVLDDTGRGMDAATLNRIFDPFFTTKFTGRGMGLAAVQGIVRAHHGTLHVQSALGAGTQFVIWLPAPPDRAAYAPASLAAQETPLSGDALVIDDEADVLAVTARMLTQLGFHVHTAASGQEALALLEAGLPALSLVLIDLTMPHMSGEAVAAAIGAARPGVPLIVMSGYSVDQHVSLGERSAFLQKPFTLAEVRAVVAAALGA